MSEAIAPPMPGYLIYDPVDSFENRAGPFFWARLPDGTQSFALTAAGRHCNSQGLVHGGLLMTMIDLTLVITAKRAADEQLVTVSLNSEFISSAREGTSSRPAASSCVGPARSLSGAAGSPAAVASLWPRARC